jgi:hypothetical protein
MREDEFRRYLALEYRNARTGKRMGTRAASDTISRCRRIESVLRIDLDVFLKKFSTAELWDRMITKKAAFKFTGPVRHNLSLHIGATRRYANFLFGKEPTSKKPYGWLKNL